MSAEEQSDESKHQQKKGWHASHSFQPSTCQSTPYERIEYWRTTTKTDRRTLLYTNPLVFRSGSKASHCNGRKWCKLTASNPRFRAARYKLKSNVTTSVFAAICRIPASVRPRLVNCSCLMHVLLSKYSSFKTLTALPSVWKKRGPRPFPRLLTSVRT